MGQALFPKKKADENLNIKVQDHVCQFRVFTVKFWNNEKKI